MFHPETLLKISRIVPTDDLSVQVVNDAVAAGFRVSDVSFGWDGAFGTHFWVDPKKKVAGILMIQTHNPNRELDRDF